MTEDDAAPEHSVDRPAGDERDAPAPRPFDTLPDRPWRGPLTFGIVAATLQMGALLWLARCW